MRYVTSHLCLCTDRLLLENAFLLLHGPTLFILEGSFLKALLLCQAYRAFLWASTAFPHAVVTGLFRLDRDL